MKHVESEPGARLDRSVERNVIDGASRALSLSLDATGEQNEQSQY
jgi:hypothetical protein